MIYSTFFKKIKSTLAKELLITVLISSSIITFFIILLQLFFEYKTDINQIENRIAQIEKSNTKSLALSVWNFNKHQYKTQLEGILNIEDIVYVEILTPENRQIIEQGTPQNSQYIQKEFLLKTVDFNKEVISGKLVVVASLKRVYHDLYDRAFIILLTQGVKTLLISFVILYAFYFYVTQHLYRISFYAREIDLEQTKRLSLNRKNKNDDLDDIVFALNNMQNKINKSYHQIAKQKELYDLVFEKASNGVVVMDFESRVLIDCNNRVVEIFKANTKQDILNMHPSQISPEFQPDGRRSEERADELIQATVDKGTQQFEWKHIKQNGEEFWAEIILMKIVIDEKILIYTTIKDINDKKQGIIELKEKSELLSKANTQLQESKFKLKQSNEQLEEKVRKRTKELETLNYELTKLSNIDPLTGAYNRRYFYSISKEMIALSKRENHSITLAMIDIDNFKKVNDTFGHDIGDEVIKALVNKINSELRESDLFMRFGGEEFVVLLPNTDINKSMIILEKVRKTIEECDSVKDASFTISIGVAEYIHSEINFEKVLKRADEGLYIAKNSGKNRIVKMVS